MPPETGHDRHGKKFWKTIQGKLCSLFLILLVPILAIEVYVYNERFHDRRYEALQANLELARATAKTFEAYVENVLGIELVAGNAIISHPLGAENVTKLLKSSQACLEATRDISWVDAEGTFVYSSNPDMVGRSGRDRGYFSEVAAGRGWYVGELVIARTTGKPVFGISRGIRDDEGHLLGVVVATVIPEQLGSVLGIERSRDAGICIIDSRGMLVYCHPTFEHAWQDRNWLERFPVVGEALKSKEISTMIHFPPPGGERLIGFTPLKLTGWVAAASRADQDITDAVNAELRPHALLFFLVTLSAFGLALILSWKLSGSIARLRDNVLAFGEGESRAVAQECGTAELDELADAFNKLTRDVKEREKERDRAAESLRTSEKAALEQAKRHRAVLDAAPAIIWIAHDRLCRIISGNRAAVEFLRVRDDVNMSKTGPEPENLMHYRLLENGKELAPEAMPIQRVAASGESLLDCPMEIHFDDGSRHFLYGNVVPFLNDDGEPEGAVAAYVDITERKLMEEELRRSRDELELRVRERTAELSASVSKLEQLNEELQEFAFIASHDLQEPLRKIRTFGNLVISKHGKSLDPEGLDFMDRLVNAAARMSGLLQSLLVYSRTGTKLLEYGPVSLTEAAKDAASDLEFLIQQANGNVEIGELPTIDADPTQMRQLFQNLIENSIKYRKESAPPRVRIHGSIADYRCRIFVEDNGIGFDERYSHLIFKPFERLHGKSSKIGGTGMGLAICKKIARRHGGDIAVRSTPDEGTTFILTLPIMQGKTI